MKQCTKYKLSSKLSDLSFCHTHKNTFDGVSGYPKGRDIAFVNQHIEDMFGLMDSRSTRRKYM